MGKKQGHLKPMKGQDVIRRRKEKNEEARTCPEVIKVFTIRTDRRIGQGYEEERYRSQKKTMKV